MRVQDLVCSQQSPFELTQAMQSITECQLDTHRGDRWFSMQVPKLNVTQNGLAGNQKCDYDWRMCGSIG